MERSDDFQRDEQAYMAAMHAVQSGVAMQMELDPSSAATTPKHLRVGVNAALVELGAMFNILEQKGIITADERMKALRDAAEDEKLRYERVLSEKLGRSVTLA